ncbi:MAG: formimidoylglutamate deiminase [Sandaracinaceae bacterium]
MIARLEGSHIVLPGLATAHSHAFQRALRGRTQRASGSFWSWRGLMYRLAERLDPESIHAISRLAFIELARSGVTAVGEFHYVHHQPDGTPYASRTELADAVIRAALDAGLRIALLRVIYARPGFGRSPEGAQRRFCDADVEHALRDAETLLATYAGEPRVTVGLAPHSVRAVPMAWIREAAVFASQRGLPFHMHVSEQRREIRECLAELGARPVRALADHGVLSDRFVAVHATHLDDGEVRALGAANAYACLCRTTERDLGDGAPRTADLVRSGTRLCFGVDSHASSDPFEEARAAELDERTRLEGRCVALDAPALLEASATHGYASIGMSGLEARDEVRLDANALPLVGAATDSLDDAVMFGAVGSTVERVSVDGRAIVEGGEHPLARAASESFVRALGALL